MRSETPTGEMHAAADHALAAVVVLYEPSPSQLARVLQLRADGLMLVAVDNSPTTSGALVASLEAGGVVCIVNANAGGIGAAFNRGAALLSACGYEAFLLLDQDSVIPYGYVAAMRREIARLRVAGEAAFLIGPRVYDIHATRCVPVFRLDGWRIRRVLRTERRRERAQTAAAGVAMRTPGDDDATPASGLLRCHFLISSGCVVSRAAQRAIGAWREDFVVDHVDTDYAMRAARSGVPMYVLPSLTLQHSIGHQRIRRWMGLTVRTFDHQPQRRYYLARNAVALARGGQAHLLAAATINLLTVLQLWAIWLIEQDKGIKTQALIAGWIDGVLKRSGPIEALRPALAARCRATVRAAAQAAP